MKPVKLAICVALSGILVSCSFVQQDERIIVKAKINKKRIRLGYDTGAGAAILFNQAAERLDLKVTKTPERKGRPGTVHVNVSEEFNLTMFHSTVKTNILVLDVSEALEPDVDGVLSWNSLTNDFVGIDAEKKVIQPLIELPESIDRWNKWKIANIEKGGVLAIEVPIRSGKIGVILIDTGSDHGLSLNKKLWDEWRKEFPNLPLTLKAAYFPYDGIIVKKEGWAEQVSIGNFVINDIAVMQHRRGAELTAGDYYFLGTLGLSGLKRFYCIIDRKNKCVYLTPNTSSKSKYAYNQIAAVFVPDDLENKNDNDLVAHVIDGGPAHEAGIRNDDILLKHSGSDFNRKRNNSGGIFGRKRESTRGNGVMRLTLMRDGQIYRTKVRLREIFSDSDNVSFDSNK